MKTIITIQHTQSIHHTNGMVGSWTDWNLSDLGKEQARRIGEKMAQEFADWNKCVGKSVQWLRDNIECQENTIDDRMFSDAESRRDVWNRLLPFFQTIMDSPAENIILVSHGDLLSVFHTMFLGLDAETLNNAEIFGLAGGVSRMFINDEGKRFIKKISDMSYIQ